MKGTSHISLDYRCKMEAVISIEHALRKQAHVSKFVKSRMTFYNNFLQISKLLLNYAIDNISPLSFSSFQ